MGTARRKPQESQPTYWFPAKRFGWGWGIANTWQGFLVQVGYLALFVATLRYFLPRHDGWSALIICSLLTVAFVVIHFKKGEPL